MMVLIGKILLGLSLVAAVCIFAVDFFFWITDRYCRFHIGRWPNPQVWEEAVLRVTRKWAKKAPTVKITDNTRYILLDMIGGRYHSHSIQSWQNSALILGLLENGELDTARSAAARFVDSSGNWRTPPTTGDSATLAYAILKTTEDPLSVKPAMDHMISVIQKQIDRTGLIAYTRPDDSERYVDTLGLICPLLALYGRTYAQYEYEELAYDQLRFYHDHGLLSGCSLPNHAIHAESTLPLGVYGWGRGTAWYVLGLLDTYCSLSNEEMKREVLGWIEEAADNYLRFQRSDGGFGSIMQIVTTYDSSATAVLAWFYRKSAQLLHKAEYANCSDRCLTKLRKMTRITGKIDGCQGDTKCIGIFSQTYDIMPFAQGFTVRAISLQRKELRNGNEIQN